ncbi:hypothetical protein B296_00006860 [Ensete ventricosum]|uniref:Uncharacterized protein n=1 Tax=Ensete ventricosum TaxID=4639 RepID=A0A426ZU11_ENSVE|nr:hypothetical protein B296_00006860 [Ensete ventricosum]
MPKHTELYRHIVPYQPNLGILSRNLWLVINYLVMPQVFGLVTKPLVSFLLPHSAKHLSSMSSEPSSPQSLLSSLLEHGQGSVADGGGEILTRPSSLRMLLSKPTYTVHYYWRKFDDAFMRPVFGGRGFVPFSPGSPTEQSLHGRI